MKTLSERQFQSLVLKFKKLQQKAESASSDSSLETYWTYGDLIARQRLLERTGYHNSILKDLSRETGISLRTLQYSVSFRQVYDEPPLGQDLTWTHLRVLIGLPSKQQRDFYARLAKKENWTSRQLEKAIAAGLHSGGKQSVPKLRRPTGPAYLYKAKELRVIDGDTVEALVDLGFHSFSLQRIRLAELDAPETRTAKGRAARNFLAEQVAGAKTITLKTHKTDLHGRYVAHIFLSPKDVTIDDCFHDGLHLNDLLVRKGHARLTG